MIIDDNRKTACVHPKDGTNYLRYLTDDEFESLRKTEQYEDEYTEMWKTFFSGGCDQREEELCVSAEFVPDLEEEACGGISTHFVR